MLTGTSGLLSFAVTASGNENDVEMATPRYVGRSASGGLESDRVPHWTARCDAEVLQKPPETALHRSAKQVWCKAAICCKAAIWRAAPAYLAVSGGRPDRAWVSSLRHPSRTICLSLHVTWTLEDIYHGSLSCKKLTQDSLPVNLGKGKRSVGGVLSLTAGWWAGESTA